MRAGRLRRRVSLAMRAGVVTSGHGQQPARPQPAASSQQPAPTDQHGGFVHPVCLSQASLARGLASPCGPGRACFVLAGVRAG